MNKDERLAFMTMTKTSIAGVFSGLASSDRNKNLENGAMMAVTGILSIAQQYLLEEEMEEICDDAKRFCKEIGIELQMIKHPAQ